MSASTSDPCGARISMPASVPPVEVGAPTWPPRPQTLVTPRPSRGAPRLVRAGPDLLVERLELVGREVLRLADADDLPLVGLHLGHRLRDLRRDVGGDRHHAVLIGMDEVARLHPQAA